MRQSSASDVIAWKSSSSGTCGTFMNISVIIVAVQPKEAANHMLTIRLIVVCSRLSVLTPSLGGFKGYVLVFQ